MTTISRPLSVILLSAPIRFYRRYLSQLLPPACRFQPSCSVYALEAIARHGAARGSWLAVKRLLRCHPISWLGGSSGFDPVPLAKVLPTSPSSKKPILRKASPHDR